MNKTLKKEQEHKDLVDLLKFLLETMEHADTELEYRVASLEYNKLVKQESAHA